MNRRNARPAAAQDQHLADRWQLFSLLVGPLAWSLFFIVGYLVVEAACHTGILSAPLLGIPLMLWLVVLLGLLTLAAIGYGGWRAYRNWQQVGDQHLDGRLAYGRDEFMAAAALVLCALFALGTIMTAMAVLVLEPCSWI